MAAMTEHSSWRDWHKKSEELASAGDIALHYYEDSCARKCYADAARAEQIAVEKMDINLPRTFRVYAASAIHLHHKSGNDVAARALLGWVLCQGRLSIIDREAFVEKCKYLCDEHGIGEPGDCICIRCDSCWHIPINGDGLTPLCQCCRKGTCET